MSQPTIYQANHPETLPVLITEPELVLESELPTRLALINNTISGITFEEDTTTFEHNVVMTGKLNGHNIGISGNNVNIPGDTPFLVSCKADGVTEIGKYLDFHNTSEDFYTRLYATGTNILEIHLVKITTSECQQLVLGYWKFLGLVHLGHLDLIHQLGWLYGLGRHS